VGTSSNLDVGQGYWIITRGSTTLTATGGVNPNANPIHLNVTRDGGRPAWNFFGYLGTAPMAVTGVSVANFLGAHGLADPNNSLTEHVIKEWRPATSSYVNASVLQPGTAYWLRVLDRNVVLYVGGTPFAVSGASSVAHP